MVQSLRVYKCTPESPRLLVDEPLWAECVVVVPVVLAVHDPPHVGVDRRAAGDAVAGDADVIGGGVRHGVHQACVPHHLNYEQHLHEDKIAIVGRKSGLWVV